MLAKISQDLVTAAWLLHGMCKDIDPRGLFNLGSEFAISVVACCASGIRNDEKAAARISSPQGFEPVLLSLA